MNAMTVSILGVVMLAACASTAVGRTVTISKCDTTARLQIGDTLVVRLESQITTGYAWSVAAQTTGIMKLAGEPVVDWKKDRDVDGGSEHQVFQFSAGAAGDDTITFHNKRAWEKDKPPLKTCTIVARVEK